MFGNSSLSFYRPDSLKVYNQVFFNANIFPPGDVLQSMTLLDSMAYLVINNSGKILVMNAGTFRHVATISGLGSPRFIEIVDQHKAYVSNLHARSITIIDPLSFEITGTIDVGGTTEQMVRHGEALFATGWSMNNQVYKIDAGTDTVIDSLTVALQPNSIVADRNGVLWVLSDGAYQGAPCGWEWPALSKIDPESFSVMEKFTFPEKNLSPIRLSVNGTGDTIYFISHGWTNASGSGSGVYRMSVDAVRLPEEPFIRAEGRLFYGLGVDPECSDIYVSDAMDYLQPGLVYRYSASGNPLDTFGVDIAPGSFCFRNHSDRTAGT